MRRFRFRYFNDNPPPAVPPPPPPPAGKTYTQAELDAMFEKHRKGLQAQNADLAKQLEELRASSNLTAQEKQELQQRIDALSSQHLTEAQKREAAYQTLEKKFKTDTETLTAESTKWKGSFEKLLVTNAILKGCKEHGAASDKQITAMLLPQAKVAPEVDDKGEPTGNYVAKVPITVTDPKTKKPVTVELPIEEAIGRMRADDEYSNLFLVDGKPGLGGKNNGSGSKGGPPDFSKMTPAQYAVWRKEEGLTSRG